MIPANAPELVTTPDQLAALLKHLRAEGRFAYDSEFIGELTYHPKLCLIQAASSQRVSLIDPLAAELDLRPFWELICDPSVEKIVHAGPGHRAGLRVIWIKHRRTFSIPKSRRALRAWRTRVALGKLVLELIGAKLGKGLTFTHWDQRPLSAMQLAMPPTTYAIFPRCDA